IAREESARGPLLVLTMPPSESARWWDVGPELPAADAMRLLDALLDAADACERAGVSFVPAPHDLYALDETLVLARLRGARTIGKREAIDAKSIFVAAGECLLPEPAVRATPRLVRALALNRETIEGQRPSLSALREELEKVRGELAVPLADGPVAEFA